MQAANNNVQANNVNALPAVIARTDLLGHNVLFLADTHNRENDTIQYWDGKKGSKPTQAPIAFYHSTKPVQKAEDATKLVQDFSKETGAKEVIVRQRLVKESSLRRTPEGGVAPDDLNAYKERLIAAITKAIRETK